VSWDWRVVRMERYFGLLKNTSQCYLLEGAYGGISLF
jgi:hypothetical protein